MAPLSLHKQGKIAMILCCMASAISSTTTHAQCIASPANNPGASTSVATGGSDIAFTSTTNCYSADNSFTTAATLITLFSGQTANLQATNFGFNIPAGATICGIEVQVKKMANNVGIIPIVLLESYVTDLNVQIIKGGTLIGDNYAQPAHWANASNNYATYGGNGDTWNVGSLTAADVNASNFGVSFSAEINDLASLLPSVNIDHIDMTIHYIPPITLELKPTNVSNTKKNNTPKEETNKCYPNPATSYVYVTGVSSSNYIRVTDMCGRPVFARINQLGKNPVQIDVSDLKPGVYVVDTGSKQFKVIKR